MFGKTFVICLLFQTSISLAGGSKVGGPRYQYDPSSSEELQNCKQKTNLARKQWVVRLDVPVLNQGPVRMCGSYAVSSYLDIWRAWKIPKPTQIIGLDKPDAKGTPTLGGLKMTKRIGLSDPHWIGYLAKLSEKAQRGKEPINLEDGSGELALDVIARGLEGVCREDVMRKSLEPYTVEGRSYTVQEFYVFSAWMFGDTLDDSYKAKLTRSGVAVSRSCRKTRQGINQKACDKNKDEFNTIMKDLYANKQPKSKRGANALLNFINNADLPKIWQAMRPYIKDKNKKSFLPYFSKVFYKCQIPGNKYRELSPEVMKDYKVCSVRNDQSLDFFKIITNKLKNNEPTVLNYYSRFLTAKNYRQVVKDKRDIHQSVIIGKRVRQKSCQFLIQNSWGNYCKYSWECQKDEKGNEIGIWVPYSQLRHVTESIFYLEKENIPCPGETNS